MEFTEECKPMTAFTVDPLAGIWARKCASDLPETNGGLFRGSKRW